MSVELWKDGKYLGVVSARIEEYINKQQARITELAAALKEYGKHTYRCRERVRSLSVRGCTCGLSDIRARYDAVQEATP